MSCPHPSSRLSAFCDHEVGPEESRAIEGHLADCADCRRELERLNRVSFLLTSLSERVPEPGFYHTTMSRLDKKPPRRHPAFLPNLAYTMIFVLTFSVGLFFTSRLDRPAAAVSPAAELDLDTVFQEQLHLNLLSVQQQSLLDCSEAGHE